MSTLKQNTRRLARFTGYFDSLEGVQMTGWACDLAAPREPVKLHVLVDGQEVGIAVCEQPRPDVQATLGIMTSKLGFAFELPNSVVDGKEHRLGLRFPDRSVVPSLAQHDGAVHEEDMSVVLKPRYVYESFFDGFKNGALNGWVQRVNPVSGERTGHREISIFIDGVPFSRIHAKRFRGDVMKAVGGDPNCGFCVPLPQSLRSSGVHNIRVVITEADIDVHGSPVTTALVGHQLEGQLRNLGDTVEHLYREIISLRGRIADLLPGRKYDIDNYDSWARLYFPKLRARVAEFRHESGEPSPDQQPLVSVICPTYKPDITDFMAAVDSVVAQTWTNWELIVVDDGGKSLEVAARLAEYSRKDPRITLIRLKKNAGISGATNAGIKAAKGDWILFFDHDDLLVDVAIEAMLQAAQGTDAEVIYSDEDKIDATGYLQEPHFKPDFDYRYLLGCNYICHLTMVRAEAVRLVGDLRAQYDGAQDHDFLLRLTEVVPRERFLHVPEILYHWRKTDNSTATTLANKEYATNAGVQCVADHLKRVGHKATVSAINGVTLYNVVWSLQSSPRVSIIIPFKDQVETTKECVTRLLERTKYESFDIVLVDNWSNEEKTLEFCREISRDDRVRVLSVKEQFNYSRLNNLATIENSAEFFVFMNNDLFVEDENWLAIAVAEALSADDIGAVGGKFVYPSGRVQHAGVVVHPDTVATHVHHGLSADEYGYMGRALVSHEVTAVTAAAVLVRADAFREVGGFDEVNLKVAYNDVDLCLKLREAGWRIIQCNNFKAVHYESFSRGGDESPEKKVRLFEESQHMHTRWADSRFYQQDPAYSRYFAIDQNYYDLAEPD
ncbi:glycosyltransferase family 2 protein [Acetobacter fallax]|uniref:Glycosyltransferase n=1 Tax=Acetobacter fallax TaxID=1737473 RepID=A0ABX0KBI2_9PROT|nr:glycosyltransferase [Acetobacter fallax]NHO32556.1 glycosyltransferase [Acetobacter fallax]NHO36099.1 glycosyltransferase [Acetobacter fallax]